VLRKGNKGSYVRELQGLLKIAADGDFGLGTESTVNAFQSANRLTVDGVVGSATWGALKVPVEPPPPEPGTSPSLVLILMARIARCCAKAARANG
jgi:hypothetical protein